MNKECYQKAIKLLSKKEYSRPKLKAKLMSVGYTEDDSVEAISKLYDLGLLKEDWYIESKIKSLMRKGYSKNHIQQRLSQEELEVSLSLIDEIFSQNDMQEQGAIEQILVKKGQRYQASWPSFEYDERQKIKTKLIRAIISKGYSPQEGISAVERYFSSK
tara:strand:- start:537 stop:1016 length:480 start_codon:yes stop_codon:yes gene_type:complete